MRIHWFILAIMAVLLLPVVTTAQPPQAASPLQASNLLNPNVSVIGWFQAEAGRRDIPPGEEEPEAFALKEIELAFQAAVDPYARADIFAAIEDGEIDIEEGYLTWFALPVGLGAKIGKFKVNFGKFNRTHTPETAFADRPLAPARYLGEEGFSGTGASLSWRVPVPLYLNLDAEAITTPEAAEVPAFDKARKKDLTYVGRLSSYVDLNEAANVTFGYSYANGAAGQELDANGVSSTTLRNQMQGVDVTFRWKNPRRAIYRSALWQTEVFQNRKEVSTADTVTSIGLFSHIEYQFARRWRAGGRYDYTESPTDKTNEEKGGLIYVTFDPSEFSRISLQGRHIRFDDGTDEDLGFLKVTFNIGPHGAHPF